jgi:TolA-binding protein
MNEQLQKAVSTPASELSSEQRELIALELEAKRLELEIKKQQMEGLKLEQEERKYHIKDLKASIGERDAAELQKKEDRESQGRTMKNIEHQEKLQQKMCTHGKGGTVSTRDMRVLKTGGDDNKKAIIKHQMINGDIWILCLRCAKTWKPPVKRDFFFDVRGNAVAEKDGVFDAQKFQQANFEYHQALQMPTSNSMSTSVQCRFTRLTGEGESATASDATEWYRDLVGSSSLR